MSSVGQAIGGVVGAVAGFFLGGGPTGALYGAQIGMGVGGVIDPPKGPHLVGPRLQDLAVQTATYGTPIPQAYRTITLNGNVIWVQGDKLIEVISTTEQGGKGGPTTTVDTPNYYATFALALCRNKGNTPALAGIRRIWFADKLRYDAGSDTLEEILASNAASDFFTFYPGNDTQTADPLIQADRGAANVPAWRGLAYLVFERVPLADYGNSLQGLQVKVECIASGSYDPYTLVVALTESDGPRFIAADYPEACSDGIQKTKTYLDSIGVSYSLYGHFCSKPNFRRGHLFLPEYQAEASFAHSMLRTNAASGFGVAGDFSIWIKHKANSHAIYTSGVLACLMAGSAHSGVTATGEWIVEHGFSAGDHTLNFKYQKASGSQRQLSAVIPSWDGDAAREYRITRVSGVLRIYIDGTLTATSVDPPDSEPLTNSGWIAVGHEPTFSTLVGGPLMGSGEYYYAVLAAGSPASSATVTLGEIVQSQCLESALLTAADLDVTELTDTVRGYRVLGAGAIRAQLEPLRAAFPFDVVQSGYQIKFRRRGAALSGTIAAANLNARPAGAARGVALTIDREMDSQLPARIELRYLDVARDYAVNMQPAARLNTDAVNVDSTELALVMSADEAKQAADALLYLRWGERSEYRFTLPPTYLNLETGDCLPLNTDDGDFPLRVVDTEQALDGRVAVTARAYGPAVYTQTASGESGLSTSPGLGTSGATALELLDIPLVTDANEAVGFVSALTGYASAWPGGILYGSSDGGASYTDLVAMPPAGSVMGWASNALAAAGSTLMDFASTLTVTLHTGTLASVTDAALAAGANWFAYGADGRWEIIAARTVVDNGSSYTLLDLLRGQRGTEWASGLHEAGDRIVMLDADRLAFVPLSSAAIGAPRQYKAPTVGQSLDGLVAVDFTYLGVNLECLSPVHVTGNRHPTTNDWTIEWVRRSRYADWRDYVDAPLGEASEAYEIDVYSSSAFTTVLRTLTATSLAAVPYTSAQQVADFGSNQATLYLKLYQLSAVVGRGYPATVTLTR